MTKSSFVIALNDWKMITKITSLDSAWGLLQPDHLALNTRLIALVIWLYQHGNLHAYAYLM